MNPHASLQTRPGRFVSYRLAPWQGKRFRSPPRCSAFAPMSWWAAVPVAWQWIRWLHQSRVFWLVPARLDLASRPKQLPCLTFQMPGRVTPATGGWSSRSSNSTATRRRQSSPCASTRMATVDQIVGLLVVSDYAKHRRCLATARPYRADSDDRHVPHLVESPSIASGWIRAPMTAVKIKPSGQLAFLTDS